MSDNGVFATAKQAPTLRLYQTTAIEEVWAATESGQRRVLVIGPTGSGKTVIIAALTAAAVQKGWKVLVFAHRREIVEQTSAKLADVGIMDQGIVMPGYPARPVAPTQVCSIQSLHARMIRSRKLEIPPADMMVCDEAHHIRAKSYAQIIAVYPDAILIGATATPIRSDGRGLGNAFDVIVETPQLRELIDLGFAVETRVYAPATGHNRNALSFRKAKGRGLRSQNYSAGTLMPDLTTQASDLAQELPPSLGRRRARSDSVACNPMTAAEPTL